MVKKSQKSKEKRKAPMEEAVSINIKSEYVVLVVAAALFIASVVLFAYSSTAKAAKSVNVATNEENVLSPTQAAQKAIEWINAYLKSHGAAGYKVTLLKVTEEHGVYEFNIQLTTPQGSRVITQYVTKDGAILFPSAILTANIPKVPTSNENNIPKTDRPKVELFVMSYCPFGIQAEKAIFPVLKLLGNKIDFYVRFVDYAMHGEKEVWEDLRQYCIQHKVAPEKYIPYLECFVQEANADLCMDKVGIDKTKVNECIKELNTEYNIEQLIENARKAGRFPKVPVDEALNQEYGIQGSPTLVINGVVVETPRNPEALKEIICSAFKHPPKECNVELSSQNTQPGFGPLTGGSGSGNGSCG